MFVHDRMSKLFEYAMANMSVDLSAPSPWIPPCDVYETCDSFTMKVEAPGLDLADIVLEINDNVITVVGARKRERKISDENYLRIERNYGRFLRRFILPCAVDENGVTVTLKDGLLTVTIPKKTNKGTTAPVKIKAG